MLLVARRAAGLLERFELIGTSNVIAHVNHVAPHEIPGGIKTILPGYTDEVALQLGLIDTDLDLARARRRFLINERARRSAQDSLFSFRIREIAALPQQ